MDQIDTKLCTHLVYSFADLDEKTFEIRPSNPAVDIDQEFYAKFTSLKNKNPGLKTMLAVGGWVDSNINDKYSQLVASRANIDKFVGSTVRLLKDFNFDGLDVDWEYPKSEADRAGFVDLLRSLRSAFNNYGFLLSAAVPSVSTDLGRSKKLLFKIG